jgi:hypothetical protein
MKITEFRKLIREEVRKIMKKPINEEGPLSGLMNKFGEKLQDMDRNAKIMDAWKSIPKDSFQSSYEKMNASNKKEFEGLLTVAIKHLEADTIFDLCEFINRNAAIFDPSVVRLSSKILKM